MKKILSLILAIVVLNLSLPYIVLADGSAVTNVDIGTLNYDLNKAIDGSIENTAVVTGFAKNTTGINSLIIPDTVMHDGLEYRVTRIGEYSFQFSKELTSVVISSNVTSIGGGAFSHCFYLTSVTFLDTAGNPSQLTSIEESAFLDCEKLSSFIIPNQVTSLGAGVFSGCTNLESLTIPSSLTEIGSGSLSNNHRLKKLYIQCDLDTSVLAKTYLYVDNNKFRLVWGGDNWDGEIASGTVEYIHNWKDGDVVQEATYLKNGEIIYTCKSCEQSKKDIIPKLTHGDENTDEYWGKAEKHAEIKHYVDADGKTSVEILSENADENDIIWLREESDGTAAWYGLDNSAGIFEEGSRFHVQWLNEKEHPEAFKDIDDNIRNDVENNKAWLFEIGVTAPNGMPYTTLDKSINFYVQIGEEWDFKDLNAYYITAGDDEFVNVEAVENFPYAEGTTKFGVMTLSHFSPYFIYDKLTDEEKAQLDAAAKELAAQQNEKTDETKSEKNSSGSSAKTGDEIIYFTISGVSLMMTLALGLMLNSKINRRKLDE